MGLSESGAHLGVGLSHRPLSSSFLGLPYRILNINHKKELLRGLWVQSSKVKCVAQGLGSRVEDGGSVKLPDYQHTQSPPPLCETPP